MKIAYPTTYLAWDLETTGLEKEACHILEIGCMLVHDGEEVSRRSWMLNHNIEVPEKITEITGITKAIVDAEGMDPKKALEEFLEVILNNQHIAHLTHNGMRFDIEWLAYHVAKTLGWTVGQHKDFLAHLYKNAIDTAVFVKAQKLGMDRGWNETFKEWADRVMNTFAKGVKYNVAICCQELGVDNSKLTAHRALGDVEATHEIYKKILAA